MAHLALMRCQGTVCPFAEAILKVLPMQIDPPYLMFLGDVPDQLAAKTAHGIVDWRADWCLGQMRLPNCRDRKSVV